MPRIVLIDRAAPISDFGVLRPAQAAWRALLERGPVLTVVVGAPPAARWRPALRRLGAIAVPARFAASGHIHAIARSGRERIARALAEWRPDLVVAGDAGLAAWAREIDLAGAKRVLICDRAAVLREMPPADAVWIVGGDAESGDSRAFDGHLAAVPAAIEIPPPCAPAPPDCVLLPIDNVDEAAAAREKASAALARLRRNGREIGLIEIAPGPAFDLAAALRAIERAGLVVAPFEAPRFRPLLMLALAAGRGAIGSQAAFDGLAVTDGDEVVIDAALDGLGDLLAAPARLARMGAAARAAMAQHHGIGRAMQSVGAGCRALFPGMQAIASAVTANLRPEFRDLAVFQHPVTRLVSASGFVRAAAPSHAVSARFAAESADELANAWVRLTAVADDWAYFAADAILPAGVRPDRLKIVFEAFGHVIATIAVPPDPPAERAGLIAVERDENDEIAVAGWALDPAPRVLAGDRPLIVTAVRDPRAAFIPEPAPFADFTFAFDGIARRGVAPVAAKPEESAARVHAAARWPLEPGSIKIAPSSGWGQNLEELARWLAPDAPSSAALASWRDRHRGETAWLIGNGPSVRVEDLDRLAGRLTFAFNRFHLAYGRTRLRPTYTVSGDRQMVEDFGQEIVDNAGGTVLIATEQPPDLLGDYVWLRQVDISPPLFSLRPDRAVTPGGSSLFVALQLAYFMGVRHFYLYGADFRFVFERHPTARDAYRSASGDGNHFIANYRGGRGWCPPSFRLIATSFYGARVLVETDGGFIRNATRGGLLEIFPRHELDSAL